MTKCIDNKIVQTMDECAKRYSSLRFPIRTQISSHTVTIDRGFHSAPAASALPPSFLKTPITQLFVSQWRFSTNTPASR